MDCRRWSFELCEIAALNFAAGLDGLRDASDVPAAPSVPLGKSCQFAIRTLLKTRRHFQPRVSKTGRVCTYCGSSLGTVTAGPTAQHYAGSLPQISRHPLHRNRRGEPKFCAPTDRPTDRPTDMGLRAICFSWGFVRSVASCCVVAAAAPPKSRNASF